MQLYYSPGACSLASHIALREAGLKFDTVKVDLRSKKTAAGDDYSAISPKGYVPALRLDDGYLLSEGTAILPYIADLAPAAKLAPPAGSVERYKLHEWLGYINSEVHKNFSPLFSPAMSEETKATFRTNLGKRFDFLQKQLEGKEYLLGSQFSVADAYLFTVLRWPKLVGIDMSPWPKLMAWHEKVGQRPGVMAAMQAEGLLKAA
jgi:glutathione S-transferase